MCISRNPGRFVALTPPRTAQRVTHLNNNNKIKEKKDKKKKVCMLQLLPLPLTGAAHHSLGSRTGAAPGMQLHSACSLCFARCIAAGHRPASCWLAQLACKCMGLLLSTQTYVSTYICIYFYNFTKKLGKSNEILS